MLVKFSLVEVQEDLLMVFRGQNLGHDVAGMNINIADLDSYIRWLAAAMPSPARLVR